MAHGNDDGIPLFTTTAIQSEINLGDEGLTNGDRIDPYLEEHLRAGVRVVVPRGRYVWDGSGIHDRRFSNDAELVGDGMVTLEYRSGVAAHTDIDVENSSTFRMKNFTFVGDIVTGLESGDHEINPAARDGGSLIEFVNVHMPDGNRGQSESEASGYYVPDSHDGTVRWIDCSVSWFGNNGWYASSPGKDGTPGRCEWIRCYGRNNNIATFRVGGGPYLIKDCVIVNDQNSASRIKSGRRQRGVRFDEPGGPGRIENLHITVDGATSAPPMIVSDDGRGGQVDCQDVFIRNEGGDDAINDNGDYDIRGDNLQLTGSGDLSFDGVWSNVCDGSGCQTPRTEPFAPGDAVAYARLDVISTTQDNFEYEFVVAPTDATEADVRQHSTDFEDNDTVTSMGNGQLLAAGRTGETNRDIWEFRGEIVAFTVTLGQSSWIRFEVNGEPHDNIVGVQFPEAEEPEPPAPEPPSIREQADLAITSNDRSNRTSYTFVVDGSVTSTYGFEGPDVVNEEGEFTTVSGEVVGFFDGFDYNGCIRAFDWDGPVPSVYRNNNPVANSDVVECPPEEPGFEDWLREHALELVLIGGTAAVLATRARDGD